MSLCQESIPGISTSMIIIGLLVVLFSKKFQILDSSCSLESILRPLHVHTSITRVKYLSRFHILSLGMVLRWNPARPLGDSYESVSIPYVGYVFFTLRTAISQIVFRCRSPNNSLTTALAMMQVQRLDPA